MEMGDPQQLEMVADLLSTDAVRVSRRLVRIEHGAAATPLAARVRRIEPSGFVKVSALGVEERRVNVIIDFHRPAARVARRRLPRRGADRRLARADVLKVPVGACSDAAMTGQCS